MQLNLNVSFFKPVQFQSLKTDAKTSRSVLFHPDTKANLESLYSPVVYLQKVLIYKDRLNDL